jgi:mono/diheme cytochrome c family protein
MKFVFSVAVAALTLPLIPGRVTTLTADKQPSAAALYARHCASCHGKDGRAKTFKAKFNHARDLTDPLWQDEVSDEGLYNSIMNGKKKMPAYRKKLSEAQVNSVITYVRTLAR